MLQFDGALRYTSPGKMPMSIVEDIFELLVSRVAPQVPDKKGIYELLKRRFGEAAGRTYNSSSNESWARSDLRDYMAEAADNAALFVDSLHSGLTEIEQTHSHLTPPPWVVINNLLAPSGYAIVPPRLVIGAPSTPVAVPENVPSLDAQANELIQRSLAQSEYLLNGGHCRQAVQEILWLLETISTAFAGSTHGEGTVEGKYFNRIVGELKHFNRGRMLGQVMSWIEKLHGYLSAPGGGGIRHGTVLNEAYELSEGEAKLVCDLTRSYISYLLHEHQRLGLR